MITSMIKDATYFEQLFGFKNSYLFKKLKNHETYIVSGFWNGNLETIDVSVFLSIHNKPHFSGLYSGNPETPTVSGPGN